MAIIAVIVLQWKDKTRHRKDSVMLLLLIYYETRVHCLTTKTPISAGLLNLDSINRLY